MREAIVQDRFVGFVRGFFGDLYKGEVGRVPEWAVGALRGVGIDLGEGGLGRGEDFEGVVGGEQGEGGGEERGTGEGVQGSTG